jgi:prepilin signal peptidase PulO-like enzyme (type II secretory pathway)
VLIKIGLIITAMVDTTLIVTEKLQGPNDVLNAAAPVPQLHLPKLQLVQLGPAQMGYGDLFVAGLFGAVLAIERRNPALAAFATFAFAAIMDLLFLVTDTLPATVPIALALILVELLARRAKAKDLDAVRGVGEAGVVRD